MTVYLRSILEDIKAIKRIRSFANINKYVYEYKNSNTFEIRDEFIILNKGSKTNIMVLSKSTLLKDQKIINLKLIASTFTIDKLVCLK